ncbi:SNF1-related protein kinase regulatory subunit beta-2 [Sesbania bispinosa]|nr:SNF1-related protein kinase regulatory subunit beta-2 [Sesbania bispinosa]
MGSNSRGKDGEGTSGVNKLEIEENYEYDEQEMKFLLPDRLTDPHHLVTQQEALNRSLCMSSGFKMGKKRNLFEAVTNKHLREVRVVQSRPDIGL